MLAWVWSKHLLWLTLGAESSFAFFFIRQLHSRTLSSLSYSSKNGFGTEPQHFPISCCCCCCCHHPIVIIRHDFLHRNSRLHGVARDITNSFPPTSPPLPLSSSLPTTTKKTRTRIQIGRKRQSRRKPINRRPRYYWTKPENLRRELRQFWLNPTGIVPEHDDFEKKNNNSNKPRTRQVDQPCKKNEQEEKESLLLLIPNEIVLQYFGRHDLRAAIASQGGRSLLAEVLPARIMPGRWDQAIRQNSRELQTLMQREPLLSTQQSPFASSSSSISTSKSWVVHTTQVDRHESQQGTSQKMSNETTINDEVKGKTNDPEATAATTTKAVVTTVPPKKWSHHRDTRKPKGYWSLQRVLCELYEYTDDVKRQHGRPSVWMPRLSEITSAGRPDLTQALMRYFGRNLAGGGTTSSGGFQCLVAPSQQHKHKQQQQSIYELAGMIPFREWYYFEGQLELLSLLKDYLDVYEDSDYSTFPIVSEIKRRAGHQGDDDGREEEKYTKLHSLIQYYGGRKFLAARLSMGMGPKYHGSGGNTGVAANQNHETTHALNWGSFDLVFAIRLLMFVRQDLLRKSPPLWSSTASSSSSSLATTTKATTPRIWIPSRSTLLHQENNNKDEEGRWLDTKIIEFGGYENVARRLGLAFFSSSSASWSFLSNDDG